MVGKGLGGRVQLLVGPVCVTADRRKLGMAEALRDQARVAGGFAQPSRRRVAQRVCGHVLVDAGVGGTAADDPSEDRRLEASARQSTEDRIGFGGLTPSSEAREPLGQLAWQRLAARSPALAAAN